MEFKPVYDWIVVEEEAPITQTASGIYVPRAASAKELIKRCKVIAISDQAKRKMMEEEGDTLQYEEGDFVLHHSQTGIKVKMHDEKDRRYMLKYDAVLGVCLPEEEQCCGECQQEGKDE